MVVFVVKKRHFWVVTSAVQKIQRHFWVVTSFLRF